MTPLIKGNPKFIFSDHQGVYNAAMAGRGRLSTAAVHGTCKYPDIYRSRQEMSIIK
jgi:hypothetical protein